MSNGESKVLERWRVKCEITGSYYLGFRHSGDIKKQMHCTLRLPLPTLSGLSGCRHYGPLLEPETVVSINQADPGIEPKLLSSL